MEYIATSAFTSTYGSVSGVGRKVGVGDGVD